MLCHRIYENTNIIMYMYKEDSTMSKVITVNREFESAGNEIAQAVAKKLDIPYYDRFLITAVAENNGIPVESAEKGDEKMASRFQYSEAQAAFFYSATKSPLPTTAQVAHAQFDLIKEIAKEGPCVIVGRCAGHVLKEDGQKVINIFVHAGTEQRTRRAMENLKLSEADAAKILKQTDKSRRAYHKNYTGHDWDDLDQYDIILNTDRVSFDECVEVICSLYNA